jgi:protein TonB
MSATSALPPLPPPLAAAFSRLRKMRGLLLWGFGVSLAVHAILGPIVGRYRTPIAETTEVSIVSLSRRTTIKLPTPAPTPQPTKAPTPPPSPIVPQAVRTALPQPVAARVPQAHLKINVYRATSAKDKASTEEPYHAQPGSQAGAPQGVLASAPPGSLAAPAAVPANTAAPVMPTRTPPAQCAVPDAEARVNQLAQTSYPDSARELGITGDVDVLISLSASGAVIDASIYRSSGNRALDAAAMRAARETTYLPAVVACQAVPGTYTFHDSFSINNSQQ